VQRGTRARTPEQPQSISAITTTTPPPAAAEPVTAPVPLPETAAGRRAVVQALCEKLESGTPLVGICGKDGMPSRFTLRQWCEEDEELAAELAKAREAWFDVVAEQALELADSPEKFKETKEKEGGSIDRQIENRKLQVETRLRLLAKWCPHRYGDEPAAAQPTKIHVGVGVQVTLTEERRAELMAKKRAAMEGRMKGEATST
jgi:hypothetical protein